MPDSPNTWTTILNSLPPWVGGFFMATIIAVLRVIYDQEETVWWRIALESLICGALTIAAGSLLSAMGFGQNWYLGAGGIIGFMGSQSVRAAADKFVMKKVSTNVSKEK